LSPLLFHIARYCSGNGGILHTIYWTRSFKMFAVISFWKWKTGKVGANHLQLRRTQTCQSQRLVLLRSEALTATISISYPEPLVEWWLWVRDCYHAYDLSRTMEPLIPEIL
jgi:hypothetical protein